MPVMIIMNNLVIRKIGVDMLIDFSDEELDLIYDALSEVRVSSDDEDELITIETIFDKIIEASKNDNS